VNRITVVIPSRTDANLAACLQAVRDCEGRAVRIVVVDDGLQRPEESATLADVVLAGQQPFVYARNCNLGIGFAAPDDIVLLNDDALLHTTAGFQALQAAAAAEPAYGLLGSTCNNVGNFRQWPQGTGVVRLEPKVVCFVCVFLPWRTIQRVGALDERFVTYGWEDNDYCRRLHNAGLLLGIHDGVFCDHGSLTSTFRGPATSGGDIEPGRRIFEAKWGASA
jgi:GT2 family glycosyltransferase